MAQNRKLLSITEPDSKFSNVYEKHVCKCNSVLIYCRNRHSKLSSDLIVRLIAGDRMFLGLQDFDFAQI